MADFSGKVLGAVGGAIALILIVIALFSMTPTIIEQEEAVTADSDTWNFTGAKGAENLLGLSPFIWIAAIVLVVVAGSFLLVKSLGGA
jgi:ABC-type Na+ efflux pump permease subunit